MSWDEYVFEDHFESFVRGQDEYGYYNGKYNNSYSSFSPDELYYFTEVPYIKLGKIGDYYKLNIDGDIMWVHTKLLKEWTDDTVYIHTAFYKDNI